MHIVAELQSWGVPFGVLTLAARIAPFKPRVSAKREKYLLAAARARTEREKLETNAAASTIAPALKEHGPHRDARDESRFHARGGVCPAPTAARRYCQSRTARPRVRLTSAVRRGTSDAAVAPAETRSLA